MIFHQDIDFWRTAALAFAALGQTLFVLLYLLAFPWWESFLGRALFSKAFVLAFVMDFFIVGRLLGFGTNDMAYFVLYSLLGLAVWAQTVAFLRVRLAGRQNEVSRNDERAEVEQ